MGVEMLPLRFAQGFGSRAQHDRAGTQTDGWINLLMSIIGDGRDKSGPYISIFCEFDFFFGGLAIE
jgi:hypothetical protein